MIRFLVTLSLQIQPCNTHCSWIVNTYSEVTDKTLFFGKREEKGEASQNREVWGGGERGVLFQVIIHLTYRKATLLESTGTC